MVAKPDTGAKKPIFFVPPAQQAPAKRADRRMSERFKMALKCEEHCALPPSQKKMLAAVLKKCDWYTLSCPVSLDDDERAVSVASLARHYGCQRRYAQILLRRLERLGVLHTTYRPGRFSYYVIDLEQLVALALRADRDRTIALRERCARKARWTREHRAAQKAKARQEAPALPLPETVPPGPPAAEVAGDLPPWAYHYGERHTLPAATVARVVWQVAEAIYGGESARRHLAHTEVPRRILERWSHDHRPDIDSWASLVSRDLAALRVCEADEPFKLRQGRKLRDPGYLFRARNWPRVKELGCMHRLWRCGCAAAGDRDPEPTSLPLTPSLLQHGHRTPVVQAPLRLLTWEAAREQLQQRVSAETWTAWIEPLALVGEESGVRWVAALNRYVAEHVYQHYGALLADVLGPVGIVSPVHEL